MHMHPLGVAFPDRFSGLFARECYYQSRCRGKNAVSVLFHILRQALRVDYLLRCYGEGVPACWFSADQSLSTLFHDSRARPQRQ